MMKEDVASIILRRLDEEREHLRQSFNRTRDETSTKYFVLDNLLPEDLVLKLYESFPNEEIYFRRDTFRERKLTFAKLDRLESKLPNEVTDSFQDSRVIRMVSEITDIPELEGDPLLYAGGISRMDRTHFLNPHIDNSHDSTRERYRRLNLLFYVTPGITEEDGGNFELCEKNVRNPHKIVSGCNRLVVMETTKTSWHSVDPVKSDVQRCCVSNYYFSRCSPTGEDYYHVTSFLGRPGQVGKRLYGRLDNFLRQNVATLTGVSRGKNLARGN